MAEIVDDRIKELSASTGTGDISLVQMTGYKRFSAVCSIGDTFYASIVAVDASSKPTGQWETGYYTYSATNTLARTRVDRSSLNNALIDFAVGTKHVFIDLTATQIKGLGVRTDTPVEPMPIGRDPALYTSLCFQDEFNGSTLNSARWNKAFTGTTDDATQNFSVSSGCLNVWPVKNASNVWFSRVFDTDGKYYQRYGYFEISAKMPIGYGVCPQFWMWNRDATIRPEIDIANVYPGAALTTNHPNLGDAQQHPIAYACSVKPDDGSNQGFLNSFATFGSNDLSQRFNTYGCEWTTNAVTFFFNGVQVGAVQNTSALNNMDARMYIILSLWLRNDSTGGDPNSTTAPAQPPAGPTNALQIDYVRAWRLVGVTAQSDETLPNALDDQSTPAPTPSSAPMPYGQDPSLYTSAVTFSDEFSGTTLDTTKWNLQLWFDPANTRANYAVNGNGQVDMWPLQPWDEVNNSNQHNHTIDTDGKFSQKYGFFECEAKLPIGKGCWPAFWLYAHTGSPRPEIDIMEAYSGGGPSSGWSTTDLHPNNYAGTCHYDPDGTGANVTTMGQRKMSDFGFPAIDLSAGYHKYGAKWEPDGVTFYFDGAAVGTKIATTLLQNPMYVILDLWFGSASGTPSTSQTPQGQTNSFSVNYVRVWQLLSQVAPPPPPTATRDPIQSPFSSTSIWNLPISTSATFVNANLDGDPTDPNNATNTTWAPMPAVDEERIILQPTAPQRTIRYNGAGWGGGNRCTLTTTSSGNLPISGVPIPNGYYIENSGGNESAAILMGDGRTIVSVQPFTRCSANGSTSDATSIFRTLPNEDLYGGGITGSHGGSHLSTIGGALRLKELRPAGQNWYTTPGPPHVLKCAVYGHEYLQAQSSTNTTGYKWPAISADSYWADASTGYGKGSNAKNNGNNSMRMGALLAIPSTTDINALGLSTAPAKALAWTLQNYGMYIVDDGFGPAFYFNAEEGAQGSFQSQFRNDWGWSMYQRHNNVVNSGDTATHRGDSVTQTWINDVKKLLVALRCVSNNTSSTPGGGSLTSTRLQPLSPAIAP